MKGKEEENMRHITYVRVCFVVLVLTFGMLVSSAIAQEEPYVFFLETDGVIVIHGYDENGTPVQIYNSANELKWDDDVGIEPIVISGLAPGTYMLVGPPDGRMFGATNEVGEPVAGPAEAGAKALFSVASPGPLEVITVPWVATSLTTPHPAYNGHPTTFKAIARGGDGMYTYEWDFNGDGVYDYSNATPNPYDLSAKYTYPDQASYKLFIARIRVTSGGETVTGEYRVSVVPSNVPPIPVRTSVAIDDGLWRLHLDQNRYSSGGVDYGYWDNAPDGTYGGFTSSPTASAVQAFEINGHLETGNYDTNPYVETVSRGLRYMFTTLNKVDFPGHSADTNGNGYGIQVNSWRSIYELGQVMDAIAATGTPSQLAATGGTGISGRTYYDILQDMVDMYAWGQYDDPLYGGWRYNWNDWPDNSASQWGAIGMLAAEEIFGITIPQWVKDRNDGWLNYSYNADGRFGYTSSGAFNEGGYHTTPSGMVQLAFDDKMTTDPRWIGAEKWIVTYWNSWRNSQKYYAYYAFAKAMREAQQDADPEPEPVVLLSNGLDWYGDPDEGLASRLVDTQNANGGWPYSHWPYVGYDLTTAWCVIILNPTLFEPPPVAVAKAVPQEANPGDVITFDHSGSYHLDPDLALVAFRWDFDEDGIWDYETSDINAKPTHQYSDVVEFCDQIIEHIVKLEVEDDDGKTDEDSESVIIRISKYNHPPVADADPTDSDPNYAVGVGGVVLLDASQSYDPDSDETPFHPDLPQDHIVSWEWDLDNDGIYDVEGMTYPFDIPDDWEEYTTHTVQLKVTDDGTWAGPCGGSLSSETSATIFVLPCIAGAQVVIYPDTFNKSKYGKWVTGHITPPEGYEASDVVGATGIMIDGQPCMIPGKINPPEPICEIPDDPESPIIGWVAVAKFDSAAVAALLPVPEEGSAGEGKSGRIEDVPICIIAALSDGANACEVCDTIDVIDQGN